VMVSDGSDERAFTHNVVEDERRMQTSIWRWS
jgi:hypothetical protein